jgi:O-antigen/teichoic acid export membrane protein
MPLLFAPVFSDIHDTGIFSSAYRLITVIVNVMMVLSGIYGPRFARNYNNKNYALLYEDLKKTAYISMGMFLPLFLIFMIFPSEILGIFGADFRAGAHWLQIMAAGQLIYSATGLVGLLLNMIHKEKLELMLMVLSSVLMVIMMLILGYLYSITGIAIAFAVGLAFKNLVSLFFAHSILKKLIATHINHSA